MKNRIQKKQMKMVVATVLTPYTKLILIYANVNGRTRYKTQIHAMIPASMSHFIWFQVRLMWLLLENIIHCCCCSAAFWIHFCVFVSLSFVLGTSPKIKCLILNYIHFVRSFLSLKNNRFTAHVCILCERTKSD